MRLKPGVRLANLQPQMVLATMIVREEMQSCTITSANDSLHSTKSLHYKGCALDYRTKDYVGDKAELVARIKAKLGPDFDVILEAVGLPNEHLHVEYDPK